MGTEYNTLVLVPQMNFGPALPTSDLVKMLALFEEFEPKWFHTRLAAHVLDVEQTLILVAPY